MKKDRGFLWTVLAIAAGILAAAGVAALVWKLVCGKRDGCCCCGDDDEFEDWDELDDDDECGCGCEDDDEDLHFGKDE
ncbi:MAG: hypothetical protein FWF44_10525 [Defluviitaleaceae bacterium]|nr:hypothetical protein [Defluviitaleaceae bacterium]